VVRRRSSPRFLRRPAHCRPGHCRKFKRQPAYKPGSVWRGRVSPSARDGHSSGTAVARRLERPTRATARRRARKHCCLQSPLFGLAPGGACRAPDVAARAVRSYRTLSPLPRDAGLADRLRGGLLSVALSLGFPPPDVIRRRVSVEPGLSSALRQRPSGRLADLFDRNRSRLNQAPSPLGDFIWRRSIKQILVDRLGELQSFSPGKRLPARQKNRHRKRRKSLEESSKQSYAAFAP
jgi:hypothetical protein